MSASGWNSVRGTWVFTALVGLVLLVPSLRAVEADLTEQEQRQKEVRAETDRLVRRLETILRILDHNHLQSSEEKQLLDRARKTLAGLSQEQMARALVALEAAQKAEGQTRVERIKEAEARHEEIVLVLKGLLAEYDAIKSAEQAAERLEKLARDQVDLYLQDLHLISSHIRTRATNIPHPRLERLASEQVFVQRDVDTVLAQLAALRSKLPADVQERLAKAVKLAAAEGTPAGLSEVVRMYRSWLVPEKRISVWRGAGERQWKSAGDLLELSRTLRASRDRLALLRDALTRVERTLQEQQDLHEDTLAPIDPADVEKAKLAAEAAVEKTRQRRGAPARLGDDELLDAPTRRSRELGDRQAWLEHEVRDVRGALRVQVADVAGKLIKAETAMRHGVEELQAGNDRNSVKPQEEAIAVLKGVKADLERLLAETEAARSDPLTNLKDMLAKVDRLILEQKDVQAKTEDAGRTRQEQRLPNLSPKQENLAKQADEVKQQPGPAKPETRAAIDRAAREMEAAAKPLQQKKSDEAMAKQSEAIKGLEQAKKELKEQIAQMEQRRDEIAKLEETAKKLDDVAREQKKVADKAEAAARKPEKHDAKEVAKKQGEVTPQAKEVHKELEKSVPEAAKHVAESTKDMEAARAKLEEKKAPEGARKAEDASKKLGEAQKAVAKALEQMKAEEATAQAQTDPNTNPAQAAEQVAKALEQTEKAAGESMKADQKLGKPDLAKLQEDVAMQTGKVKAPEATEAAKKAADALKKGDLGKAVQEQKKALDQLKTAAQKQGKPHEGQHAPQPAEAKNAGELAQAQKQLMEATEALAQSQNATKAAEAALAQAQVQAPRAVQKQLQEAGKQLAEAGKQLPKGEAGKANQAQNKAANELAKALGTLKQAAAMAEKKGQGEMGQGEKPQGEGEKGQGQQAPGIAKKPGKSQEKNDTQGEGNREADGKVNNAKSELRDPSGNAALLNLPPRERELLKQAMNGKLPPEYAALIRQYYINLANGKPATMPPPPKP